MRDVLSASLERQRFSMALLGLFAVLALVLAATGLYGVATTRGALSIVSVVASLFPVVTVVLARVVLHERLHRLQVAGVALAISGVVLIAAG